MKPSNIELVHLRDAPMDIHRLNGGYSSLRGWLGIALGGRSLPINDPIGRLINWPCSIGALERVVAAMHAEFEGQRSLRLTWGEGDTGLPTYAALGLKGAFSVWFVDVASAAALLGSVEGLRTEDPGKLDGTHADLAFDRLEPLLVALPRAVPGSTFDLDAENLGQVARRVAAEVLDMERANISHAKCLAMMSRSIFRKLAVLHGGNSRVISRQNGTCQGSR